MTPARPWLGACRDARAEDPNPAGATLASPGSAAARACHTGITWSLSAGQCELLSPLPSRIHVRVSSESEVNKSRPSCCGSHTGGALQHFTAVYTRSRSCPQQDVLPSVAFPVRQHERLVYLASSKHAESSAKSVGTYVRAGVGPVKMESAALDLMMVAVKAAIFGLMRSKTLLAEFGSQEGMSPA